MIKIILVSVFSLTIPTAGLLSQFQNQNLVAHYLMDGNAKDVSGFNNHGTLYGPNSASDRFGNENLSYYFNGQSDFILVPNSPSLNPTDAITVAAWYKTTPFAGCGNDAIVNKAFTSHSPPYYQYQLGVGGNQYSGTGGNTGFGFSISLNNQYHTTSSGAGFYSLYTWYFIVGTYDGSIIKLYVNGNLVGSKVATGKMQDYGSDIYIGRHKNVNNGVIYHLPGTIDDVRIYSRALSQQEILNLFNATTPMVFNFSSQGDCVNTPVNFNYTGFSGYDSLKWNFGDNSFSKEISPAHVYKKSGTFDVTLSMFYQNQKNDQKKAITIADIPSVKLGNDTTLCPGNVINLKAGSANATTYTWNTGLVNNNIFINKPGTYHVTATNACGSTKDTINIHYSEFASVWVTSDTTLCRNLISKISAKGPSQYQFIWNNSYEGKEFELQPTANQTLDLMVVNEHNCQKSFRTLVYVKDCFKEIIIPNVFTPNGDGKNDFWVIENLDKYPNALVEVFNRWGESVYRSVGYLNPWDGYFNGKRLSSGCYYYNIILNAGHEAYKGPLMIYQ